MKTKLAPFSIHRMGESALLVSLGDRISEEANRRVHSLTKRLRSQQLPGLVDLVPAYSSLLIQFEPSALPEELLREYILSSLASNLPEKEHPGRKHVIPVQYGGEAGPDLESLAGEVDLTSREIIGLHSGRDYRVYFLGFMPGFAYMGAVPRRIAMPRLATPRIRIPAGSVGIASTQTGIYPFNSPGGWRIIGRTSMRLWDITRDEPALFAPGDYVRFVESDFEPGPVIVPQTIPASERPAFEVLQAGAFTTIQDLGRPGYGSVGLCRGGAMDPLAVIRANALVGNPVGTATLELTWTGPTLRSLRTVTIALDGADFGCFVDSTRVPSGLSWLVRAGSTIRFEQSRPSPGKARAYLAVSDGFDVPEALGSRSTYLPAAFGGYAGRALQTGDVLGIGPGDYPPAELAGRLSRASSPLPKGGEAVLRFTRFSGVTSAGSTACQVLTNVGWTVSEQSDRIGARLVPLEGRGAINRASTGAGEAVSFGVVRGAIQLPPSGNPVILGADHQTTGGYPLIGVVAEADWPLLAQLCPGSHIRFEEITVEQARHELGRSRAKLQKDRDSEHS